MDRTNTCFSKYLRSFICLKQMRRWCNFAQNLQLTTYTWKLYEFTKKARQSDSRNNLFKIAELHRHIVKWRGLLPRYSTRMLGMADLTHEKNHEREKVTTQELYTKGIVKPNISSITCSLPVLASGNNHPRWDQYALSAISAIFYWVNELFSIPARDNSKKIASGDRILFKGPHVHIFDHNEVSFGHKVLASARFCNQWIQICQKLSFLVQTSMHDTDVTDRNTATLAPIC